MPTDSVGADSGKLPQPNEGRGDFDSCTEAESLFCLAKHSDVVHGYVIKSSAKPQNTMNFLQRLFAKLKPGISYFEVPIKTVHDRLPEAREHGAFKLVKEKYPNIPDEHIDMLVAFAYTARDQGVKDIGAFLLANCEQYQSGQFFIKKSRGKYCLCSRK